MPNIVNLALQLPKLIRSPVPLLRQGTERSLSLTQLQIASLLANAFLCTFPWRNDTSKSPEYKRFPSINFSQLFHDPRPSNIEKIKCIFHYFQRVGDPKNPPRGVVTFTRRFQKEFPKWHKSTRPPPQLHITSNGRIETEGRGMLQVDFANKLVGGGVLSNGCVQEEILFVINPELLVARLFTEQLLDNEALVVTGTERFSSTTGYSQTFKWDSNFEDDTPKDKSQRRLRSIVAMDATPFHNTRDQYLESKIQRDLNKAFVGFHNPDVSSEPKQVLSPIATGNWGCGAFNGDPTLKALIQVMAAAEAGRRLRYFTFNDEKLAKKIKDMMELLKKHDVNVGKLYTLICSYKPKMYDDVGGKMSDLYTFMKQSLLEHDNKEGNPSTAETDFVSSTQVDEK